MLNVCHVHYIVLAYWPFQKNILLLLARWEKCSVTVFSAHSISAFRTSFLDTNVCMDALALVPVLARTDIDFEFDGGGGTTISAIFRSLSLLMLPLSNSLWAVLIGDDLPLSLMFFSLFGQSPRIVKPVLLSEFFHVLCAFHVRLQRTLTHWSNINRLAARTTHGLVPIAL